jgi:hypothetical protein
MSSANPGTSSAHSGTSSAHSGTVIGTPGMVIGACGVFSSYTRARMAQATSLSVHPTASLFKIRPMHAPNLLAAPLASVVDARRFPRVAPTYHGKRRVISSAASAASAAVSLCIPCATFGLRSHLIRSREARIVIGPEETPPSVSSKCSVVPQCSPQSEAVNRTAATSRGTRGRSPAEPSPTSPGTPLPATPPCAREGRSTRAPIHRAVCAPPD